MVKNIRPYSFADYLRLFLTAWLYAAMIEFFLLDAPLRDLAGKAGLENMSFLRMLLITAVLTAIFWGLSRLPGSQKYERWYMVGAMGILLLAAEISSFTAAFAAVCLLVLLVMVIYGRYGWDRRPEMAEQAKKAKLIYIWITAALSVAFFLFVSVWTVARVYSFCVPSYDFGIFSQMFYYMKETGLPMTTLERDGLLSHFHVHMSPIYYLMLPFYCLVPIPATLQVLQAAVLASSVIPLWKICKIHGLSGMQRTLVCAMLLLYPAFAGGTGYDIHENCFLTPLILWLLYGIDRKSTPITAVAAVLTLMVKEDAAVYVGIIAVWLLTRSALRRKKGEYKGLITGGALLVGALVWFFAVTGYLAQQGDGVMTYRYDNFLYGDSDSLVTVIAAVIMNPMKALYECVDREKLQFILQTMLPLLAFPFFTRRFERYILLIPYVLVNLMSDYQYQHDIFFQYTFGSTACLLYLTAVNLADVKLNLYRVAAAGAAVIISFGCFVGWIMPTATVYPKNCGAFRSHYDTVRAALDTIPTDASVTATTFYTTHLSQRKVLYDLRYCSREHLLSTEYVALNIRSAGDYKRYGGYDNLVMLLEYEGYTVINKIEGQLVIYHKPQTE